MDIVYDEPFYFTPEDTHIKRLIKEQGIGVCRDYFDNSYLNSSLSKFEEGYIILMKRANIGRANRSSFNHIVKPKVPDSPMVNLVKGFILFTRKEGVPSLNIELFCVRESSKGIGEELLNKTFHFCENNGITTCLLYSLPYDNLVEYYRKHGFEVIKTFYKYDKVKAYLMSKDIPETIV